MKQVRFIESHAKLVEIEAEFCDTFIDSKGAKRIRELIDEAYQRGRDDATTRYGQRRF